MYSFDLYCLSCVFPAYSDWFLNLSVLISSYCSRNQSLTFYIIIIPDVTWLSVSPTPRNRLKGWLGFSSCAHLRALHDEAEQCFIVRRYMKHGSAVWSGLADHEAFLRNMKRSLTASFFCRGQKLAVRFQNRHHQSEPRFSPQKTQNLASVIELKIATLGRILTKNAVPPFQQINL